MKRTYEFDLGFSLGKNLLMLTRPEERADAISDFRKFAKTRRESFGVSCLKDNELKDGFAQGGNLTVPEVVFINSPY